MTLRIVHCFRAPVGGLFRHVRDLTQAQSTTGLEVGLICDSEGDEQAHERLRDLEKSCALGVHRLPMGRQIGLYDLKAVREIAGTLVDLDADIVHGHGAKGGAYARLAAAYSGATSVYTPHGGSLHYSARTPSGVLYLALEKILAARTGGIIFDSRFSHDAYNRKIARPVCPLAIIPNGLAPGEFAPVDCDAGAADFVFVGELRRLKGVDLLLDAIASLRSGRPVTAAIVGSGPDDASLRTLSASRGLAASVSFVGNMPAREAFRLGRCLVVPSRNESFPYIVLEAAAARKAIIATRVGGIPEIFGAAAASLIQPDSVEELAVAMQSFLDAPEVFHQRARQLALRVAAEFPLEGMVSAVNGFYDICHRARSGHSVRPAAEAME